MWKRRATFTRAHSIHADDAITGEYKSGIGTLLCGGKNGIIQNRDRNRVVAGKMADRVDAMATHAIGVIHGRLNQLEENPGRVGMLERLVLEVTGTLSVPEATIAIP